MGKFFVTIWVCEGVRGYQVSMVNGWWIEEELAASKVYRQSAVGYLPVDMALYNKKHGFSSAPQWDPQISQTLNYFYHCFLKET